MFRLLVYLVFIFSVSFAAGGIVLSTKLRSRYKSGLFSSLLYFQVFIFTFGFYGIWGQLFLKSIMAGYVSGELLARFTNISLVLGLPFLVFAWFMLIKFSRDLSGRESSNRKVFLFLLLNFLAILGLGFYVTRMTGMKPDNIVKYYFIGLNFVYSVVTAITILFTPHNKPLLFKNECRKIAFSLLLIMTIQCLVLAFYKSDPVVGIIFIFVFFAGNIFLPVFLSYLTRPSFFMEKPVNDISFVEFCQKFEVSPRESEIVREICNGLSNKEISDKLFISLQTVKDHTHRIYIKTNVRSRAQLMNLVKRVQGIDG